MLQKYKRRPAPSSIPISFPFPLISSSHSPIISTPIHPQRQLSIQTLKRHRPRRIRRPCRRLDLTHIMIHSAQLPFLLQPLFFFLLLPLPPHLLFVLLLLRLRRYHRIYREHDVGEEDRHHQHGRCKGGFGHLAVMRLPVLFGV